MRVAIFLVHSKLMAVTALDVQQDHTLSDSNRFGIHGFTGKLTWDLGFATLISVSAYSKQTKRETLDVDSGPAPQFITMKESEWDWFTQELRLEGETDRFRWIVGAYYLTLDTAYSQGLADTIGGINVFAGLFFNGFLTTANDFIEGTVNAELETDSYSLFGQVDYDLTDQLMLSVGFRGIIEEKDYTFTNRLYTNRRDDRVDGALFGGGSPFVDPFTGAVFEFLPPFADDTSDFLWSGKVQLNWQPNEDWLVYAGVNRGVKAGSFNAPLLTFLTPDEYGYDEEVLLAYEAGFKSTLLDGKARLNVAGYYYDYSDYQAFQFIGTSGAIFNVDAEHMGVEAELVAKPVENLDLLLGLGFIDPEVEDLLVAPNTPRDTEPTFTPEIQFNGIGRYTFPGAIMGGDVALQVDGNYASSTFYNINNFGTHRMGSYWLGNIRISWVSADERLEIGGFVKNVGDTRYQRSGFELSAICGCDEAGYGEPRWWGATIRYSIY